jgi:monoamine oxidase
MDIDEQSSINFLIMLDKTGGFYGEHEIYKIKGGSQHLADAVYSKVKETVKLKHVLTAILQDGSGYKLTFSNHIKPLQVYADYVVLALPFTVLRKIQMDVPMPESKRKCIDEFSIGNSAKFIMQAGSKPWRINKQQGYTFTDESFGCGWDSTHMQSQSAGSFTVFGGGKSSGKIFNGKAAVLINEFEPQLKKAFPCKEKLFAGKQIKMCWAKQPFAKGGYTSFKKGQYSTIAGWEAEPVGNIFFAGEHVSGPFQGFMNGAAQTGRFAAEAIAAKIIKEKN